jgi:LmbE family N-acetylglucosaminyl deacetylase
MTLPGDKPCYGLYICLGGTLTDWEIQAQNAQGKWETIYTPGDAFYHQYVALSGLTHLRIYSNTKKPKQPLAISEIRLLGKGRLPGWVQVWHRMEGKADLMIVVAHPDDEYLFIGGTIPYYAGEKQKKVIVVYLVNTHSVRKSELLNGLWQCGVRDYPEMGTAKDYYQLSLRKIYDLWHEEQIRKRITRFIRQYRPDVLVTHDVKGEYGHGAHMAAADVCKSSLTLSQDSAYDAQSAQLYGTWQIPKMYLHLFTEKQLHMDWQKPLSAFLGHTAIQVAKDAFKMHVSQQKGEHNMENVSQYDSSLFGLYHSTVGPDVIKNDFFENLPPH